MEPPVTYGMFSQTSKLVVMINWLWLLI